MGKNLMCAKYWKKVGKLCLLLVDGQLILEKNYFFVVAMEGNTLYNDTIIYIQVAEVLEEKMTLAGLTG